MRVLCRPWAGGSGGKRASQTYEREKSGRAGTSIRPQKQMAEANSTGGVWKNALSDEFFADEALAALCAGVAPDQVI